jgi:hypothetical protein
MWQLTDEEWKVFKKYDEAEPTQEEIDFQEECRLTYAHHECQRGDNAIRRFWSLK